GEWDSINQQLRLYLNSGSGGSGLIIPTQTHTASPDATGRFIVGADMIGQTRRFFTGVVSNPVLVPGVADQTQIGLMSGTQVVRLP
ncbi:MAG: hypothetical protein QOJ78_2079, partial [Pseudonocardiales bacterium]|nr:hypothetical protein [Pseudonocardiales bacterium]